MGGEPRDYAIRFHFATPVFEFIELLLLGLPRTNAAAPSVIPRLPSGALTHRRAAEEASTGAT